VGASNDSDLRVHQAPDSRLMEVRDSLDVFRAQSFADAALHCVDARLDTTLDCAALERIDASALQVLCALRKALRATSRELSLVNVPESVASYLEIAGFGELVRRRESAGNDNAEEVGEP
jgi:anti-anti-sigma factor